MGLGVGSMHYVGMRAMMMPAILSYDHRLGRAVADHCHRSLNGRVVACL